MRESRRIFAGLLALLLFFGLGLSVRAEEDVTSLYKDKSWDDVVQELLDRYKADPASLCLGYYNTVTGEEHYLNPDQYMVAASMYKVPLNMIYAEKVANGEMDWDTRVAGYRYEQALEESIVHSNNTVSVNMSYALGNNNWRAFRRILAPYMGADPDTVEPKFFENNFSTARQMISCLRLLYEENERFPRIIETMQRAEPHNYFKLREQRFNIAHKYGFLSTEWHLYMNDCAIAYTDDPILLVLYSDNTVKAYDVMADYCTMMCDYTQVHTAQRKQQEAEEQARIQAEEEARRRAEEEAAQAFSENSSGTLPTLDKLLGRESGRSVEKPLPLRWGLMALGAAALALLFLAVFAGRLRRKAWLPALLVLLGLGLGEWLIFAPALAPPEGDPQETASAFLEALKDGRFETAYTLVQGHQRLGLEKEPETELARALSRAIRENGGHSLYGECRVDGTRAYQLIDVSYLDLNRLLPALQNETMSVLTEYAFSLPLSELYSESGGYRSELKEKAALEALDRLLGHSQDYLSQTNIQLELQYEDGAWVIVPGDNLLRMLLGGLGEEGETA